MSTQANGDQQPKLSPRDLAIIVGTILALVIAAIVITKTVNANRVRDVIVIKGAKGAKPMGNEVESPEGGASDRLIITK
jgi:hypothetical protein